MKIALRAAAAAFLTLAASHAGCIQMEEESILYPDGSGRVTVRMGLRKSVLKMIQGAARERGEEAPIRLEDLINVEKYAGLSEGVAAWVAGPREEDGQWIRLKFVGYFEDITKVRIYDESAFPEERGRKVLAYAWSYERRVKGGKLSLAPGAKDISRGLNRLGAPRKDAVGKAAQELETLKPLLEDLKVSISMTVPGPVAEFGGFREKNDRTVRFSVDGTTILGVAADQDGDEARRLRGLSGAFVTWTESTVSDAEIQAFRKELAEAKEAWARRRGLPVESRPAAPKKKSLAEDADRFSDDEVNRAFVRAQIRTAKVYLNGGKKDQAREILESVVKEYEEYAESAEAKTLLESLKK